MKILQTVSVKQILTENSKKQLLSKYEQHKMQLQKECDHLLFEMKKMEKSKKYSPHSLKTQFNKEIDIRKEKIKLIELQMEQIEILPLGSEIHDQDIQAIFDIQVGDNWDDIIRKKSVIVKDGIIIEIRER